MATNFPGSNDVFTEPSTPASTPLGSAGDSSRNMTNNHGDLGLAIMAMQAEATFLVHVHDGTTRNGPKLVQANTHQTPDTDLGATSLHHTVGTGANQGAAGNHSHGATVVWPLHAIFITELVGDPNSVHGLPGTWTQVTGEFIVAAGSTFTAGTTGGSSTHTHTAAFSTTGAHTHTSPNTDNANAHSHTNPGSGTSTYNHDHGQSNSNSSSQSSYTSGSGSNSMTPASHNHASATPSVSGSSTSHSHGVATSDTVTGLGVDTAHQHTVAGMDTQGNHTHTSTISTGSHIPPYLSVYVWERTA